MFEHPPPPFRRWLRHTASVPKGFLRYYVLKLLREKPMSGSEIMETIEKRTDGHWKPSPGSVYPLLAWLQDNRYTKEISTEETGIKRYRLTEKGEKLVEEQVKFKERLQKKLEFFAPPIFSAFWFSAHPEKLRGLREPEIRFVRGMFNLQEARLKTAQATLRTQGQKMDTLATIVPPRIFLHRLRKRIHQPKGRLVYFLNIFCPVSI